ncbi:MAG TPA: GH1 family beta-glucosidase [Candidatus Limnocylindrales bacterium]|nr:GH1 family beta-glucosidase [Candidatus Limnocylindrales bacterium]
MTAPTAGARFLRFPDGFLWGAATSAYQIEGGVGEDGRGASIWDRFSHTPGRVENDETADVTSDHYHRWREDVELIGTLGLTAYRFSIAWPRVQPGGWGPVNAAGLAFYDRLIDALLERGVQPCPTLYHWDLPAPLGDAGGWLARDTVERFADYAAICFDRYGDRVRTWFTINEPWVVATLGYRLGLHAPGHRDLREAVVASHHLLLAHGAGVEAFRASGRDGAIGIVLSCYPTEPATESEADRDAATGSDGYTTRWFLEPVVEGRYPGDMLDLWDRLVGPLPEIRPGDAVRIGTPSDHLGVNSYTRRVVAAGTADGGLPWTVRPASPDLPHTDTGWEIVPFALTELLVRLRATARGLPIIVTENGAVFLDQPDPSGRVADRGRIAFLRVHLAAVHRAIELGADVRGYFHWSLLDNFEWAEGFRSRFGLIHVDYPTGRRLVKDSGRAYARIVADGGFEATADELATARERAAGVPA